MKLQTLIESQNALHRLSNAPLPAAVAFRLARLLRVVQPELQTYEEARLKLAASFGELSEDGRQYNIPKEQIDTFNEQLADVWTATKTCANCVSQPGTVSPWGLTWEGDTFHPSDEGHQLIAETIFAAIPQSVYLPNDETKKQRVLCSKATKWRN